jgi:hypothetical protein
MAAPHALSFPSDTRQREDSGAFDCTSPRMSYRFDPPRSDAYQSSVKAKRVSRGTGRIRSTTVGQIEGRADKLYTPAYV